MSLTRYHQHDHKWMARCHYHYLFLDIKIACNLNQMEQKFCLATENCWMQDCNVQARNLWCRRHYSQINPSSLKVHKVVHNKKFPRIVLYIFPLLLYCPLRYNFFSIHFSQYTSSFFSFFFLSLTATINQSK